MTWPTRPLAELCDLEIGKTPSRANLDYWRDGTLPWLSIADMNQGRHLRATKERVTDAGAKATRMKLVRPGTIVLSYKLSIGKVGFVQTPMFTNEAIAALANLDADVWPDYMYWALQHMDLLEGADRAAMGSTLNKAKLEQLRVPLPPLPEQRRIAAILDKADALRAKRREALAKLDQLLQSVFLDMFGEPSSNHRGWPPCSLGDLISAAQDGPHVSPTYAESGIPFLSTRHIRAGRIHWTDLKYISESDAQIQWKKCKPQRGDILYTKGGTTGLAAVVDNDDDFAVWVHVALLKTRQSIADPVWLAAMLNTKFCYDQSQRLTRGIANRDLGLKRMVDIQMFQPPISEQKKYSSFAAKVFEQSHKLVRNDTGLEKLQIALKHQGFSGAI